MNCERIRQRLAFEPPGTTVPRSAAVRFHLEACARCRSFWHALIQVDEALAGRPLACPEAAFAGEVMRKVRRYRRPQIAPPFSRAFFVFGAALTLCALVGGALLLHHWSASSMAGGGTVATLWLSPAWPGDASVWLTMEGERVAQIVLAAVAGVVISLVSAAVGFRASGRSPGCEPAAGEHPAPRRS